MTIRQSNKLKTKLEEEHDKLLYIRDKILDEYDSIERMLDNVEERMKNVHPSNSNVFSDVLDPRHIHYKKSKNVYVSDLIRQKKTLSEYDIENINN